MLEPRAVICVGIVVLSIAWMPNTHAAKTYNLREPVLEEVLNPCDPAERVFFSGERTVSLFLTETRNTFHLHGHSANHGVSGFGLLSGDEYRVIGVEAFQLTAGKGITQSVSSRLRLIRLGSTQNLLGTSLTHITVNARGDVTVVREGLTIECH
jgi:hypothetical protein